jgi:formate dehydrogenase subunit gamma
MMINGELHAKVTPQKFDMLLAAAMKQVEQPA